MAGIYISEETHNAAKELAKKAGLKLGRFADDCIRMRLAAMNSRNGKKKPSRAAPAPVNNGS